MKKTNNQALIAIETVIIFLLVTVTPLFLYFFMDEATEQVKEVFQVDKDSVENIEVISEEELIEKLEEADIVIDNENQIIVEVTKEGEVVEISDIQTEIEEEISEVITEEVEEIITEEEIDLSSGHGTSSEVGVPVVVTEEVAPAQDESSSNEEELVVEDTPTEEPEEEVALDPETPDELQILTQEGSGNLDYTMTANAGSDQTVFEYDSVTLNAFESAGAVSYSWSCEMDGDPITLTNADSRLATFRAPLLSEDKVVNCTLSVQDLFDNTISKTDTMNIYITNGPIANAGVDQTVEEVDTVYLTSLSQGAGLLYSWECDNSDIIIQNANTANAFFSAPFVSLDTATTCILSVRDLGGEIDTDEVVINIKNGPIAISQGDIVVTEGREINLNASSSIGAISSYEWSCDNGFTNIPTTSSAYFLLAPQVEQNTLYNCSVTATDLIGDTSTDEFTIHVLNYEEIYSSPRVYFDPYTRDVTEGKEVTLYPSVISEIPVYGYYWVCTFNGTPLTLSNNATLNPRVTIPYVNESGKKVVCSVTAYNDSGAGGATQSLNILNGPIANAGIDQTKYENQLTTLSGSYQGNITSINWTCDNDTILTNATTLHPTFTTPFVDLDTTITCEMEVVDGEGKTDSDTVLINIINGPKASVSNLNIREGNIGTIPNASIGDNLSYNFSCEDTEVFTLTNQTSRYPTVVANEVDENTSVNCSLTITDSQELEDTTTFVITVTNYIPPTYTTTTPTVPTTPVVIEGENEGQQEDGGAFYAEVSSDGTITLVWEKGENTTHTYIRRMQDTTPTTIEEGDLIYFNTGETCEDPELPLGNTYCYSAWGYSSTLDAYSETYASACILVDFNIVSVEKFLLNTTEYIRVNVNTIGLTADLNLKYKKQTSEEWTQLTPREDISSGLFTFEIPNLEAGGVTYDYEVILTAAENTKTYTDTFVSEVVKPSILNTETQVLNAEKALLNFDLVNGGALTNATIEYADNIDFNDPITITLEDQYSDSISQTFTNLIQDTTYYYRINAVNEKGDADEISGSFLTESLIEDVVVSDILTKEATLTFNLNTDNTEADIDILIADNPEFTDSETISITDQTSGEVTQVLDNLIQNQTYYIKITVLDKEYPNEASVDSFTTLQLELSISNFTFYRLTTETLSLTVLPEQDYSYLWTCDTLMLDDVNASSPTLTTPDVNEDTTYNCSVTVTDTVNSDSLDFTVTVNAAEEGWIAVPGNDDYGTSDFLVMKYEAKNVDGVAVSQSQGTPWVNISQTSAISACEAIDAHLITNEEWMTIARNIESVSSNWSGGEVGLGYINRGYAAHTTYGDAWSNTTVAPYTGSLDIYNTGVNTCSSVGEHLYKRTHTLSNGEDVWDLSGNVREWIDKTLTTTNLQEDFPSQASDWWEYYGSTSLVSQTVDFSNNTYISYSMVGPLGEYNADQGIGRIYIDTDVAYPSGNIHAFLRGGYFEDVICIGIYCLNLNAAPTHYDVKTGFRCVQTLSPTVSNAEVDNISSKSADISLILDTGEKDYADVVIIYADNSEYVNSEEATLLDETSGSVSTSLSQLTPNQTYYYSIRATSEKGPSNTIEGTFTTEDIVLNLTNTILTSTADIVFDLNTDLANISLTYADNIDFTDAEVVSLVDQTEGEITASFSNLTQGTIYYYELEVIDSDTYTYLAQDTFTTDTISVTVPDYNVLINTNTDLTATITPEQDYTYLWSCDSGNLTNSDTASPTFTIGAASEVSCSLIVSDGVNEGSDSFTITTTSSGLDYSGGGYKTFIVSNSNSTLTDYQIKVELLDTIGMSEDLSDLRFADSEYDPMYHWIESTSPAVVWVKVPTLPTGDSTIYMYYGGEGDASYVSSGENTFVFFDDFTNTALNTEKWSIVDGATVSVSDGICDIQATSGSGVIMGIRSIDTFGVNTAIRTRYKLGPAYSLFGYTNVGSGGWNGAYNMWRYDAGVPTLYSYSSSVTGESDPGNSDYYIWDLIRNGTTSLFSRRDGAEEMISNSVNTDVGHVTFTPYSIGHVYADWVFVRDYVSNEPVITDAFGNNYDYACYDENNNQTYLYFTTTGKTIWTVPSGVSVVDLFLVGGGGGANFGGAGGGYTKTYKSGGTDWDSDGYIKDGDAISVSTGDLWTVYVANGGIQDLAYPDANGEASSFTKDEISYVANGGQGGKNYGNAGGSGGGAYDNHTRVGGDGGTDGSSGLGTITSGGIPGGTGQGYTTRAFAEESGFVYSGGGGGATAFGSRGGYGGVNGGGNGTTGYPNAPRGGDGVDNTGGGAGGSYASGGGNGGSGIVIIRFSGIDNSSYPVCTGEVGYANNYLASINTENLTTLLNELEKQETIWITAIVVLILIIGSIAFIKL
jgi:hypothetical protein